MAKKKLADALKPNRNDDSRMVSSELNLSEAEIPSKPSSTVTKARLGKKHVGGYFDQSVPLQMTILAAELSLIRQEKVKIQDLLAEAINDLFEKHDKPRIA